MNHSSLSNFIRQAFTGDLKTKEYPKTYRDLDMKVSFGQGTPTHIPWVSFLASGMTTSRGYYPVYLFFKRHNILVLAYGISETYQLETTWPDQVLSQAQLISDLIESPFRYGDSYVHRAYNVTCDDTAVSFYQNEKKIDEAQLQSDLDDLISFYKESLDLTVANKESQVSQGLFYMEAQLEDFLIHNWDETDLGKTYDLIYEDGELISQQYKTDIGRIDILARNKATGSHVVVELKRNQTSDDTVGQILRYMGWVEEKLNDSGVTGLIIAGGFDPKLDYAIKRVSGVSVYSYKVSFELNKHEMKN